MTSARQVDFDVLFVARVVGSVSDEGEYLVESYTAPDQKAVSKLVKKLKRGTVKNFMKGGKTVPKVVEYSCHGESGEFCHFAGKRVGDFIKEYLQLSSLAD